MSELNSGRGKAWNIIYSNNNSSSSPSPISEAADANKLEGPWKSLGSSMNAISFGFVATAILISMFLIMAIFEHLFRPNASSSSSSSPPRDHSRSTQMHKLNGSPQLQVQTSYSSDISVVMPGEQHPRFIGQPTPLACAREGVHWPSHLQS
ncbi:hypothetical protein ACS0TY_011448 [Phlomoides rotata]